MKKVMILLGLGIGLITLMSSQCNNSDSVNPECDGPVSATASDSFDANYCFDLASTYNYVANEYVVFWAHSSDANELGFDIRLNAVNGVLGPGTYGCAVDEPGFVELIIEGGDNSDFYKSKSGTLTISEVNESHIKGSFSVVAVGYYTENSINFSGTIDN